MSLHKYRQMKSAARLKKSRIMSAVLAQEYDDVRARNARVLDEEYDYHASKDRRVAYLARHGLVETGHVIVDAWGEAGHRIY